MFGMHHGGPRFDDIAMQELGGGPRDGNNAGSGYRIALMVFVLFVSLLAVVWIFAEEPGANPLPLETTPIASPAP